MLSVRARFTTTQIPLPTLSRCPSGIALTTPHAVEFPMLLVGGCMIMTDANYRASAMIHVPEACATQPASMPAWQGCIDPGALNYAPGAVQITKCLYKVNGCTSSTALNYNSEAAVDDGSCVEPILGCTVNTAGYAGVATDTPGYKARYVGVPTRVEEAGGVVTYPTYGAVNNYSATANVLSGCVTTVEGCMDPTAVNYNPHANANTNTWCVPRVEGCMMPGPTTVKSTTYPTARAHFKDGGSGNFSVGATVHINGYCSVGRYGCTDPLAINYESKASIDDGTCWYNLLGCLDKSALNFNCSEVDKFTPCAYTMRTMVPTAHLAEICQYTIAPPSPPRIVAQPGQASLEVMSVSFTAVGDVSDYTDAKKDTIKIAFATQANVPVDNVDVIITSGSVNIEVRIAASETTSLAAVQSNLAAVTASPAAASAFLSAANVQVISTPRVESVVVPILVPPAPPPAEDTGAIIGGVIGGIVALLLCACVVVIIMKQRSGKATYPA